jgi:hypothetical protein
MKLHKSLFLIFVAGLIGCSDSKETVTIESLKSINVNVIDLNIDVEGSIYGHLIELKDDTLLLISSLQTQNMYHLFSLVDFKKISSFGVIGKGPTEIPYPLHIYDSNVSYVLRYNPSLAVLGGFTHNQIKFGDLTDGYAKSIDLPRDLLSARDVFLLTDAMVVGTYDDHFNKRLDSNRGIFTLNTTTNSLEIFPLTNFTVDPNDVMGAMNINARTSTFSRSKGVLLIASVHNPIIESYNLETNEVESHLVLPELKITETFKLDDFKKGVLTQFFTFIDHSDSYIYLLYHGYSESEDRDDQKIIVMNWSYEPVYVIQVPYGYLVSSFQVNIDDSYLIAHSIENDSFYKFQLSINK